MRNRCCLCQKTQDTRTMGGGTCSFFKVPKDDRVRNKWSELCRVKFSKQSMICEDHFVSSDIIRRSSKNSLMPSAVPFVPVLHEYPIPLSQTNSASSTNVNNTSPRDCLDISMEESFDVSETTARNTDDQPDTDPISLEHKMSKKNKEYKAMIDNLQTENKNLQAENEHLKRKLDDTKAAVTFMRSVFTEGQVKTMITSDKVEWSRNDISSAIRLHASGPKAYNYLYKKGFPLPHASVLEFWCRQLNIYQGFLDSSLDFMKNCTELTNEDKICVLAFDELKVVESDAKGTVGNSKGKPVDFVQVVTVQGLWKSWKRPVFFDFDCQMKEDVVCSIIKNTFKQGFPVVAMVCHMGPTNRKLLKDLGVTMDRPWFPNPVNPDEKVFTFFDPPQLLDLIRYHFLDTGLMCDNKLLTSSTIKDLMKYNANSDTSIILELTDEHLSVKVGGQKLAAELFSDTTANAIRHCNSVGMNLNKPIETANFIQLVNDWFDILNSTTTTFSCPGKEPFGIALLNQQSTLMRMNKLMSSPIIPNKTSLEYFQEGVIMTNYALQMLYDYVRLKFNMIYVITNRLNLDVLKHVFWAIRKNRDMEGHPRPKKFKYRLRKYILARNMEHLHGTDNVETDTNDWFSSTDTLAIRKYFDDEDIEEEIDSDHEPEVLHEMLSDCESEVLEEQDTAGFDEEDIIEEDVALAEYISGYAASD